MCRRCFSTVGTRCSSKHGNEEPSYQAVNGKKCECGQGLLGDTVSFIVATSGGGVFDVVNLVVEPDHLKQTHCADHVQ